MTIDTVAPPGAQELRQALYAGRVFKLPPTVGSRLLVDAAYALVRGELGEHPRVAAQQLDNDELFERIGRIRRTLYLSEPFHALVGKVLGEVGQTDGTFAFDPVRLRTILAHGQHTPSARSVYYPHRDTWYGHPQGLITAWIPLDDLAPEETFVFYPERFDRSVPNNSEIFDYDEWVAKGWGLKIGWQQRSAGLTAPYPGVIGASDPGREVGFSCQRGEVLLFSGAQFHRTLPQVGDRARFSLDFRFVSMDDHSRGLGAPNVDNRSRGSALHDYVAVNPGGD